MTAALRTKLDNTPMAPYLKLMRNMNREQKLAVLAYIVDTLQNDENEDKNEYSEIIKIAFRRKQILFKNAFCRKQLFNF
ncbi:MAG: hypothetical protein PUC50_05215 [Bacteroidales bacterium]|nr:hypothetical protein [Bacteroidales bacterium]